MGGCAKAAGIWKHRELAWLVTAWLRDSKVRQRDWMVKGKTPRNSSRICGSPCVNGNKVDKDYATPQRRIVSVLQFFLDRRPVRKLST